MLTILGLSKLAVYDREILRLSVLTVYDRGILGPVVFAVCDQRILGLVLAECDQGLKKLAVFAFYDKKYWDLLCLQCMVTCCACSLWSGMYLDTYDQGILEFKYIIIKGYWELLCLKYIIKENWDQLCLQYMIK